MLLLFAIKGLGSSTHLQDALAVEDNRHNSKLAQLNTDYQVKLAQINC